MKLQAPRGARPGVYSLALAAASVLVAGCRSAEPAGETGNLGELSRLLEEGGARPVTASVQDGAGEAPADDPLGVDDEAAAALLEEPAGVPGPALPSENPYIRFGERIVVKETEGGPQIITKPFPMPPGKAERIVQLIAALEPFPFRPRPAPDAAGTGPPYDLGTIEYELLADWDREYYSDLEQPVPTAATPVSLADMLVVTATAPLLEEFEAFIDTFSAGIPQIELEAKVIEVLETDTKDVGVNAASATLDPGNVLRSFSFDLPNIADGTEALLSLGAVQDDTEFEAMVELLQTWRNVTIETRPKTVVRAGGVARLESTVEFPFFEIRTLNDLGNFTGAISYKKTGVKLYITPRVVGSRALALDVQLENSQTVSFQPVASSGDSVISVPVIASRTARTIVYLEPGQTLLIGGLTQENTEEIVDKVPILGDIPILGFFFRSTFEEVRREHVIFAISPRIIQQNDLTTSL